VTPVSGGADLPGDPAPVEAFEVAMRGYSRRDVDDFAGRARQQLADLQERLDRALAEADQLRAELATAQQAADKPAHEEVSERIGQIFTVAGEQAQAQQDRAAQDIATLRSAAQEEADGFRAAAISQTQQMLAAAQEHAEHAITTARAEADTVTRTAQAEAEAITVGALAQAEAALAESAGRGARLLEEATARAAAIHGAAESRVGQLTGGRTEAIQQLTDIREIVASLLVGDSARGSLAEEVASTAAATLAVPGTEATAAAPQPGGH
jgi:cell division septum initiation protein DivIVA